MKKRLIFVLSATLILSGCGFKGYHDNQVYIVNKDKNSPEKGELVNFLSVNGPHPFRDIQWPKHLLNRQDIMLHYDDKNKQIWYMSSSDRNDRALCGRAEREVNILRIDTKTGISNVVEENVPFIYKKRQGSRPQLYYFYGGNYLSCLNTASKDWQGNPLDESDGKITNVFSAPDEKNKLYFDVLGIVGGEAYYVESERYLPLYQTKDIYYAKGILEDSYYYATQWRKNDKEEPTDELWTVIGDAQGKVVRTIAKGNFIDGYGKSLLIGGSYQFGLTFVRDLNVLESAQSITDRYIYDAGFFADGGFYCIVDANKRMKDQDMFLLKLYDHDAKEKGELVISGSSLYVSEDGKEAYSSGLACEKINLPKVEMISQNDLPVRGLALAMDAEAQLIDVVKFYGAYVLGDQKAEKFLIERSIGEGVKKQLKVEQLYTSMQNIKETHVEAFLKDYDSSADGRILQTTVEIHAVNSEGRKFYRNLNISLYKTNTGWRISNIRSEKI